MCTGPFRRLHKHRRIDESAVEELSRRCSGSTFCQKELEQCVASRVGIPMDDQEL